MIFLTFIDDVKIPARVKATMEPLVSKCLSKVWKSAQKRRNFEIVQNLVNSAELQLCQMTC